MLLFIDGEDLPGPMGEVPRRWHIGEQDEAAPLFLPPADALGVRSNGRLQPLVHGGDRAWLVGARPAPAIHGLFLHGNVHSMVRGGHGAELQRRRFRISTAEIRLLLRSPGCSLDRALRGLEVPCQPLLPPLVLRAGVHNHRPIRCPVERHLALRGFLGRHSPVLGRLRVGEDADLFPGVVRHGISDEPPALVIRGG